MNGCSINISTDNKLNASSPSNSSKNDKKSKNTPLFQKIIDSFKVRFFESSKQQQTPSDDLGGCIVTCRICDNRILTLLLEDHTKWCSQYQDCAMKKDHLNVYLNAIEEILETLSNHHMVSGKDICNKMRECISKALSIDEFNGKSSAISLAKLQYRLAKIELTTDHSVELQVGLKRIRHLVFTFFLYMQHHNNN